MKGLSYEERLRTLNLYSMEFSRMSGELVEIYRISRGLDTVNMEKMCPLIEETLTQGHSFRVKEQPFRTQIRMDFFSQMVREFNGGSTMIYDIKAQSGKVKEFFVKSGR
eukprot:g44995.t1